MEKWDITQDACHAVVKGRDNAKLREILEEKLSKTGVQRGVVHVRVWRGEQGQWRVTAEGRAEDERENQVGVKIGFVEEQGLLVELWLAQRGRDSSTCNLLEGAGLKGDFCEALMFETPERNKAERVGLVRLTVKKDGSGHGMLRLEGGRGGWEWRIGEGKTVWLQQLEVAIVKGTKEIERAQGRAALGWHLHQLSGTAAVSISYRRTPEGHKRWDIAGALSLQTALGMSDVAPPLRPRLLQLMVGVQLSLSKSPEERVQLEELTAFIRGVIKKEDVEEDIEMPAAFKGAVECQLSIVPAKRCWSITAKAEFSGRWGYAAVKGGFRMQDKEKVIWIEGRLSLGKEEGVVGSIRGFLGKVRESFSSKLIDYPAADGEEEKSLKEGAQGSSNGQVIVRGWVGIGEDLRFGFFIGLVGFEMQLGCAMLRLDSAILRVGDPKGLLEENAKLNEIAEAVKDVKAEDAEESRRAKWAFEIVCSLTIKSVMLRGGVILVPGELFSAFLVLEAARKKSIFEHASIQGKLTWRKGGNWELTLAGELQIRNNKGEWWKQMFPGKLEAKVGASWKMGSVPKLFVAVSIQNWRPFAFKDALGKSEVGALLPDFKIELLEFKMWLPKCNFRVHAIIQLNRDEDKEEKEAWKENWNNPKVLQRSDMEESVDEMLKRQQMERVKRFKVEPGVWDITVGYDPNKQLAGLSLLVKIDKLRFRDIFALFPLLCVAKNWKFLDALFGVEMLIVKIPELSAKTAKEAVMMLGKEALKNEPFLYLFIGKIWVCKLPETAAAEVRDEYGEVDMLKVDESVDVARGKVAKARSCSRALLLGQNIEVFVHLSPSYVGLGAFIDLESNLLRPVISGAIKAHLVVQVEVKKGVGGALFSFQFSGFVQFLFIASVSVDAMVRVCKDDPAFWFRLQVRLFLVLKLTVFLFLKPEEVGFKLAIEIEFPQEDEQWEPWTPELENSKLQDIKSRKASWKSERDGVTKTLQDEFVVKTIWERVKMFFRWLFRCPEIFCLSVEGRAYFSEKWLWAEVKFKLLGIRKEKIWTYSWDKDRARLPDAEQEKWARDEIRKILEEEIKRINSMTSEEINDDMDRFEREAREEQDKLEKERNRKNVDELEKKVKAENKPKENEQEADESGLPSDEAKAISDLMKEVWRRFDEETTSASRANVGRTAFEPIVKSMCKELCKVLRQKNCVPGVLLVDMKVPDASAREPLSEVPRGQMEEHLAETCIRVIESLWTTCMDREVQTCQELTLTVGEFGGKEFIAKQAEELMRGEALERFNAKGALVARFTREDMPHGFLEEKDPKERQKFLGSLVDVWKVLKNYRATVPVVLLELLVGSRDVREGYNAWKNLAKLLGKLMKKLTGREHPMDLLGRILRQRSVINKVGVLRQDYEKLDSDVHLLKAAVDAGGVDNERTCNWLATLGPGAEEAEEISIECGRNVGMVSGLDLALLGGGKDEVGLFKAHYAEGRLSTRVVHGLSQAGELSMSRVRGPLLVIVGEPWSVQVRRMAAATARVAAERDRECVHFWGSDVVVTQTETGAFHLVLHLLANRNRDSVEQEFARGLEAAYQWLLESREVLACDVVLIAETRNDWQPPDPTEWKERFNARLRLLARENNDWVEYETL